MSLRNRLKDPTASMRAGMLSLILASLARWFLHPSAGLSANVVDATTGFLYGLAIAFLLLGLAMGRGRRSGGT
jgi:hypothetical protein